MTAAAAFGFLFVVADTGHGLPAAVTLVHASQSVGLEGLLAVEYANVLVALEHSGDVEIVHVLYYAAENSEAAECVVVVAVESDVEHVVGKSEVFE